VGERGRESKNVCKIVLLRNLAISREIDINIYRERIKYTERH